MKQLYYFLIPFLFLVSCGHREQTLIRGNWKLTYTDEALSETADRLASYLAENDRETGKKTGKLSKNGNTYTLEIRVKDPDPRTYYAQTLIARELSDNVLQKAPLNLVLRDERDQLLREFPFAGINKIYSRGNLDIYYKASIPDHALNTLADFMEQAGFVDEQERTIRLDRNGKHYILYLITDEETASDPYYQAIYQKLRKELQEKVMHEPVSIYLSNPYFEVLARIED